MTFPCDTEYRKLNYVNEIQTKKKKQIAII